MVWNKRLLSAFCALMLLTAMVMALPAQITQAENENILRLHILANSDSPLDQAVKLKVRDALLKRMPASASAVEAESYLLTHGSEMLATVEEVLNESGMPYGAQLMLGRFPFPDRTYGETVYPAGEYSALRVLLGNAAGQNWWCVLFPPLCIVTEEAEEMPETTAIAFESSLLTWVRGWRDKK